MIEQGLFKLFVVIMTTQYSDEIYLNLTACDLAADELIEQHAESWSQIENVLQPYTVCQQLRSESAST